MDDLTKEQRHLLISMYKEILSRQPALSMEEANMFHNSDEIKSLFLPNLSSDHVSNLCWKLKSKEYLVCTRGDNLANDISLSDNTIIYMENRFKNGIKDITSFLTSFIP